MSMRNLPVEIIDLVVTSIEGDSRDGSSLACLSRTCKDLYEICWRRLYRHVCPGADNMLSVAYTLLTCPNLAYEVRKMDLPACARETPFLRGSSSRRGWPDVPDLDKTLRKQVERALVGEDAAVVEECFRMVRDGSRTDLVAMLMLTNVRNLELLLIGAMGPIGDDSLTRIIFRNAAPHLTRLTQVCFGKTPYPLQGSDDIPRPDLEFSYSLFADLFHLPAMTELYIYSMAPFLDRDVSGIDRSVCTFFDFIRDINFDNTTLEKLYISEETACTHAHLGHILVHCTAVNFIEFYVPNVRSGRSCGSRWGKRWDVSTFQKALECRADTIETLGLQNHLRPEPGSLVDQRARIDLNGLLKLDVLVIDTSWIFSREDVGFGVRPCDLQRNSRRLVSLLPQSIRILHLIPPETETQFDESLSGAIRALVESRTHYSGFQNLSIIDIAALAPRKRYKAYIPAFDAAEGNGVCVYLCDRKEWWSIYPTSDQSVSRSADR